MLSRVTSLGVGTGEPRGHGKELVSASRNHEGPDAVRPPAGLSDAPSAGSSRQGQAWISQTHPPVPGLAAHTQSRWTSCPRAACEQEETPACAAGDTDTRPPRPRRSTPVPVPRRVGETWPGGGTPAITLFSSVPRSVRRSPRALRPPPTYKGQNVHGSGYKRTRDGTCRSRLRRVHVRKDTSARDRPGQFMRTAGRDP